MTPSDHPQPIPDRPHGAPEPAADGRGTPGTGQDQQVPGGSSSDPSEANVTSQTT